MPQVGQPAAMRTRGFFPRSPSAQNKVQPKLPPRRGGGGTKAAAFPGSAERRGTWQQGWDFLSPLRNCALERRGLGNAGGTAGAGAAGRAGRGRVCGRIRGVARMRLWAGPASGLRWLNCASRVPGTLRAPAPASCCPRRGLFPSELSPALPVAGAM